MKVNAIKTLVMAAGLTAVGGAMADTFVVSGTVNNVITVTEDTALSLGTVALTGFDDTGDGGTPTAGTLTIAAFDGAISSTPGTVHTGDGALYGAVQSKFTALGGQSAGSLTISGGPANGIVNIDKTGTLVDLDGGPTNPKIALSGLSTFPATSVTLDGTGAGTISVGMTFSAVDDSTNIYSDGVYTGSYDILFSY